MECRPGPRRNDLQDGIRPVILEMAGWVGDSGLAVWHHLITLLQNDQSRKLLVTSQTPHLQRQCGDMVLASFTQT